MKFELDPKRAVLFQIHILFRGLLAINHRALGDALFFSATLDVLRPLAHGGLPERRSLLALRAAAAARSDRLLGKLQAILEVYGARSTRASAPVSSEASDAACSPGTATQDGW